jgi:hypothetical protein
MMGIRPHLFQREMAEQVNVMAGIDTGQTIDTRRCHALQRGRLAAEPDEQGQKAEQ